MAVAEGSRQCYTGENESEGTITRKECDGLELRVLEYYLMVAREENITRAAELLHITQPTLSRQIAQLEEELGVKLFYRGKHSITMTEDGLLLKRRAQELVDLADKTKQELTHDEKELSGTIFIGSGETKSMHLLAELLAEFRSRHPRVDFDLYSATSDDIKERIEKGLIDIGLLMEPVDVGKYQFLRVAERVPWGVLVRRDCALAGKASVTAADLLGIPVILTRRDSIKNELANWFGEYFDRMEIAATYNLLYNAAILAEHINGAVLCMGNGFSFENLVFVPIEPRLETGSVLVWKKSQFFSQVTASFIEFVRNAEKV